MRSLRIPRARIGFREAMVTATAIALCLPLAACGAAGDGATPDDGSTPTPSVSADTTVPDACTLLTPDLIQASTGVADAKEKFDKERSVPGTSVCHWTGSGADVPSIEVVITNLGTGAGASPGPTPSPAASSSPNPSPSGGAIAAQRASVEASVGPATDTIVAGGLDAFVAGNGSVVGMNFQKISAKKVQRSYYVQVTYTSGDSSDVTLISRALAALVATAL